MTNEEAIKTIEIAIAEIEWDYPMNYAVAFEMAIKALEENSDKIRDREESIREFSQLIVDKIDSGLITDSSDIDDYVEDYLGLRSK